MGKPHNNKRKKNKDSSSESDDDDAKKKKEIKVSHIIKATKKLANQMKTESVAGYTDEKNPFNDENLTTKFVWGKKIEKEGKKATEAFFDEDLQRERIEEIAKVQERRKEYERAKVEREEERDKLMRDKAMEGAEELEEREEKFHFEQILLRADIRMKNNRAKPIDVLVRALHGKDFENLENERDLRNVSEFHETFDAKSSLFMNMTERDLQELKDDCINLLKLCSASANSSADIDDENKSHLFWTAIFRLTEAELLTSSPSSNNNNKNNNHNRRGRNHNNYNHNNNHNNRNNLAEEEEEDNDDLASARIAREEIEKEMMGSIDLSGSLQELVELETEIRRSIDEDLEDETDLQFWKGALAKVTLAKYNRQCREILTKVSLEKNKKGVKFAVQASSELATTTVAAAANDNNKNEIGNDADGEDDDEDDLLGGDFAQRVVMVDNDGGDDYNNEEDNNDDVNDEEENKSILVENNKSSKNSNNIITYGDEPIPLSAEKVSELIALANANNNNNNNNNDIKNDVVLFELIDEDEDLENIQRLRVKAKAHAAANRFMINTKTTNRKKNKEVEKEIDVVNDKNNETTTDEQQEQHQSVFEDENTQEHLRAKSMAENQMGKAEDGDVQFSDEVRANESNNNSQIYWWHDKYKPRKPRYFNRVHTGYEWNKYNSTHYDHDNPPPKTVQGYKFNIFFPDLIDKSKAPTYKIERDSQSLNDDTCILKVSAGPPYEDIAFRIVNKEWEYSHKFGFRCVFERGIFHLYVNFKRPRYRR